MRKIYNIKGKDLSFEIERGKIKIILNLKGL